MSDALVSRHENQRLVELIAEKVSTVIVTIKKGAMAEIEAEIEAMFGHDTSGHNWKDSHEGVNVSVVSGTGVLQLVQTRDKLSDLENRINRLLDLVQQPF